MVLLEEGGVGVDVSGLAREEPVGAVELTMLV